MTRARRIALARYRRALAQQRAAEDRAWDRMWSRNGEKLNRLADEARRAYAEGRTMPFPDEWALEHAPLARMPREVQ